MYYKKNSTDNGKHELAAAKATNWMLFLLEATQV